MKNRKRMFPLLLILLLAALAYWLWPRPLTVTKYSVAAKVQAPVRIVQLSDLHGKVFGTENAELIDLVSAQNPDLIFLTGDMLDRKDTDLDPLCTMISALKLIAPVYYSYGNHETAWINNHEIDLLQLLTDAGVTVLDCAYADLTVNGQPLRIGGYTGIYRVPHLDTSDMQVQAMKLAFADDFENTERQKLLLAHIPTSWVDWNYIDRIDAGIVFCGHYHGGLMRFPVLDRGLYAPYVGWFPKNTIGLFHGTQSDCILSAGLSGADGLPRIYNPPEVVVAELVPDLG